MTTTAAPTTVPDTRQYRRDTRLLVGLTAAVLVLQIVLELLVVVLQPDRRPELLPNITSVMIWSLAGLALTWGLVLLGRRDRIRAPMAWTLAVLGLAACAVFYFLALPTTLATGAYILARSGSGHLRAARVVAIVGIAASFVVSVAMMYTYL